MKKWKKLHKQKGHNPGGIYMSPGGIKCYVKFQTPVIRNYNEHLANLIYAALGVPVPETQVAVVNGRKAFVSKLLPKKKYMSLDGLKAHSDVVNGFVADAFMANFDVVGLKFKNIIMFEGRAYRVDNGGALFFYAKGEPKPMYEKDRHKAKELRTMRSKKIARNPARVFHIISNEQIIIQAVRMEQLLTDQVLDELIMQSGMPPKFRVAYYTVLKQRREAFVSAAKEMALNDRRPFPGLSNVGAVLPRARAKSANAP